MERRRCQSDTNRLGGGDLTHTAFGRKVMSIGLKVNIYNSLAVWLMGGTGIAKGFDERTAETPFGETHRDESN